MADGYSNPGTFFPNSMEGLEALAQQLKYENQSPAPSSAGNQYTFHSHTSSNASSAHNSDEDDSGEVMQHSDSYRERRREAHTEAERKRREAIKKGYDELQDIVPTCKNTDSLGSTKVSKATILQKSIEYIQHLQREKKKQEDTLEKMRRDVMALKIMKANYEHIVKAHQGTAPTAHSHVTDQHKFQVFQSIMDRLFQSFSATVSMENFAELSGCVFSWLEEYCKPQLLKDLTTGILHQVTSELSQT